MSKHMEAMSYWLALSRVPKLSNSNALALVEYFKNVEAVFDADTGTLASLGLKPESVRFIEKPDWSLIEDSITWHQTSHHHIVTWQDCEYPTLLRHISSPPLLLYVDGDVELLSTLQLSVVGSRRPTAAGKRIAQNIAADLASKGITVTSGLALGIDGQSHQGALDAGGKTIAVLGNGIDNVYPVRHRNLAKDIKKNGAVISEYPPSMPPLPQNFPQRNRIISGLSVGTLVIEAAQKSGSLITARLANEQGREVFAIPGSILNPLSAGCHRLLKEGAKLTEGIEDILEEILPCMQAESSLSVMEAAHSEDSIELDRSHKQLLEFIGYEPISIDSLVEMSGLTTEMVSSMLLNIEIGGYIQSELGGGYSRVT